MHGLSCSRQQINLFVCIAVSPLHIWSGGMWSHTIKITIMDTVRLGEHFKNASEVTGVHLFIFIGVWAPATNLIYLSLLLRVQNPDIQKWGGTLRRISNALLIHPPLLLTFRWESVFFISVISSTWVVGVFVRGGVCVAAFIPPSSSAERGEEV